MIVNNNNSSSSLSSPFSILAHLWEVESLALRALLVKLGLL
jgi:hypothetical protein